MSALHPGPFLYLLNREICPFCTRCVDDPFFHVLSSTKDSPYKIFCHHDCLAAAKPESTLCAICASESKNLKACYNCESSRICKRCTTTYMGKRYSDWVFNGQGLYCCIECKPRRVKCNVGPCPHPAALQDFYCDYHRRCHHPDCNVRPLIRESKYAMLPGELPSCLMHQNEPIIEQGYKVFSMENLL